MIENVCPLCGGDKCSSTVLDSMFTSYRCEECDRTVILGNTIHDQCDRTKRMLLNLVFEYVMRKPFCKSLPWRFFYNDSYKMSENDPECYINLADIHYPNSISEKSDRVLLNLSLLYPEYSDVFISATIPDRAVFPETDQEEERKGFLSVLVDIGYLREVKRGIYSINALGWQRIEMLNRGDNSFKQGFIAMSFSPDVETIGESIKCAIKESGYSPLMIKDKEHNHQIVPEILYEIDRSKFLVMDVTLPNFGAYYEAGYALGKGKEVIISCRKEEFDNPDKRPHFDILQKSLVVWEDEKDLMEKLQKRIEATVK